MPVEPACLPKRSTGMAFAMGMPFGIAGIIELPTQPVTYSQRVSLDLKSIDINSF